MRTEGMPVVGFFRAKMPLPLAAWKPTLWYENTWPALHTAASSGKCVARIVSLDGSSKAAAARYCAVKFIT